MTRPVDDLRRVADAQLRLEAAIAGLGDGDVRSPSALPGWTVGHLLTHIARNADSHVRRTEAAWRGEQVDQYPGGYEGRARDIEDGASRPATEVLGDVHDSALTLSTIWDETPDEAWSATTRDVGGTERPLRDLPSRRWHELEVHAVDLGVGVTHDDWSDEFVAVWLRRARSQMRTERRSLGERDELAWLYGRLRRDDLPVLPPWG
jgi:maleylpyruvate isomerase